MACEIEARTEAENAHGFGISVDAHASSCTVAVVGPRGRKLQTQVLETNVRALIAFLATRRFR